MEEELRSHLRSRADDLERQGLSRSEAERHAHIEFGGYQRYKEECREAMGRRSLAEIVRGLTLFNTGGSSSAPMLLEDKF